MDLMCLCFALLPWALFKHLIASFNVETNFISYILLTLCSVHIIISTTFHQSFQLIFITSWILFNVKGWFTISGQQPFYHLYSSWGLQTDMLEGALIGYYVLCLSASICINWICILNECLGNNVAVSLQSAPTQWLETTYFSGMPCWMGAQAMVNRPTGLA